MHKHHAESGIPKTVSPRPPLDGCLVDGDAAAISIGRRQRRKALGISLALETASVALLVVAPLMSGVAGPIFSHPTSLPFLFSARHLPDMKLFQTKPSVHSLGLYHSMVRFEPGRPARPALQKTDEPEGQVVAGEVFEQAADPYSFGIRGLGIREVAPPPPVEIKKFEMTHPVKVNAAVEEAKLILRIEPRYPPLALMTRTEGTVVLHAFISREGRITALDVVSGPPLLVKAALDAVQEWRYRPTLLDGEPVEVETAITVIFRLQR
jgi:periplasmic protein TonB